uniref:Uncharacterized protein n=1 Tax=Parascaris univalens TaxID=6257 RepID=A0A914ZKU6_PARUN
MSEIPHLIFIEGFVMRTKLRCDFRELERRKIEAAEDTKISTYTHTAAHKCNGEGGLDANACNTNDGKLPQKFIAVVCSAERPQNAQEHYLEERFRSSSVRPGDDLLIGAVSARSSTFPPIDCTRHAIGSSCPAELLKRCP